LAINIYAVAYGIKNADGILLGGSDMVNVQKNLSPDPAERSMKLKLASWSTLAGS
tara:strand:- start:182 stop:346 length:165 start_codon:yes stop_codon:yes gene_type:complete